MAYTPDTNPPAAITEGGLNSTLTKLWVYVSADTNVAGAYFSDGANRGMRVNDILLHVDTTTPQTNLLRVTALAALDPVHPNATRSATLSTLVKIGN